MTLTPAEVFMIKAAHDERDMEMVKYQSWLTASLTGFTKVPPFEKCFPKDRVIETLEGPVDIGAIFRGAGHQVIQAND